MKRLMWRFRKPAWAANEGIWLPCRHPGIAPNIARQIYFGEYESKEVDIVSRKHESSDVVVEVAAGLGFLSALCARRIGSDRVHAFEANPAMLPLIRSVYERNGVAPHLHNALLAEGSGERTFYVEPEFWASSAKARSESAKPVVIEQRDLNSELARLAPSFLIVDIEGGELEFFAHVNLGDEGISQVFARLFGQGFVLDFGCIRKNVFFFYRR